LSSHAGQLYFECHDENVSEKKINVPIPGCCFENNFFLDINQAGFSLKRTVATNVVIMTKCKSYKTFSLHNSSGSKKQKCSSVPCFSGQSCVFYYT
jgi:hypothetical protein